MATATALSWAVLAIALKFALHTFSSGTIVWIRLSLAFGLLLAFALVKRPGWLSILKRPPVLGLAAGAFIAGNYFGFMKGIELTTASHAQILIQLAPLSFAVLSVILYGEIPSLIQKIGMAVALLGFGFFYWDQLLLSWDKVAQFQEGNLWLIFAAILWTLFALIQKRLLHAYRPQQFNLLIYGLSALILLPTANFQEFSTAGVGDWLLVLFLSLNTIVAYGALSEALLRIPSSHVSMIISVNPLLTIFLMTILTQMEVGWIAGEPIGWRGLTGALLVVIGVISTVYTPRHLRKPRVIP